MIDLRDLLDERSANPPGPDGLRIASVRRRITQRRRRRLAVAASAAAAVLLLFGGYLFQPALRPAPDPGPAATPSPSTIEGFAEYAWGTRVAAAKTVPVSVGTFTLTWTARHTHIALFDRCEGIPDTLEIWVEFSIADRPGSFGSGCGGATKPDAPVVTPGEAATVTITLKARERPAVGQTRGSEVKLPNQGTFSIAVAHPVAFADYPLPPRPEQLKPLHETPGCFGPSLDGHTLRSDPADPLRPMTIHVPWRDHVAAYLQSQTPGFLSLSINGVTISTSDWWNYDAGLGVGGVWDTADPGRWSHVSGWKHPRQGELVAVTVSPEHVTGDWIFHALRRDDAVWASGCG